MVPPLSLPLLSLCPILAIIMHLCSVSISVFYLVLVSYCCMCPTLLHAACCTLTFFMFSQFWLQVFCSPFYSLQSAASFCPLMSSYFRVIIFYSVIKRVCVCVCCAQTTSMARLQARPRTRQRERERDEDRTRNRCVKCVLGILNRISLI